MARHSPSSRNQAIEMLTAGKKDYWHCRLFQCAHAASEVILATEIVCVFLFLINCHIAFYYSSVFSIQYLVIICKNIKQTHVHKIMRLKWLNGMSVKIAAIMWLLV